VVHVLVVEANAGFAALLASELERMEYGVVVCAEGYDAYQAARDACPDLALIDVELQEPDAFSLARSLRLLNAEMRIMLISAAGAEPGVRDTSVAIQGVLPRPFFLPELPERIAAALLAPFSDPEAAPTAGGATGVSESDAKPQDASAESGVDGVMGSDQPGSQVPNRVDLGSERDELQVVTAGVVTGVPVTGETRATAEGRVVSRRAFRLHQGVIETLMTELAQDVGAAGVLLTCPTGLLTAVGSLTEDEIDAISRAVLTGRRASAEVARLLGREQERFEQSTTGDSHMLYALGVHDAILVLTVKGETQLGLLRHRARGVGEQIARLCL